MELRMSQKERDRIRVLEDVVAGRLKQCQAAEVLHLSSRQLRRIARRYRTDGGHGLVHDLRGRQSNRKIVREIKKTALKHLREEYRGFGPTLAAEKLLEPYAHSVDSDHLIRRMAATSSERSDAGFLI